MDAAMKTPRTLFLTFLTVALILSIAQPPTMAYPGITPQEIIEKVQARYEKMTNAYLEFTQSVRYKVSKANQTTSGKMYFKKKNRYRIETGERTIVTNGTVSWSWSPSRNQVIIDRYKEQAHSLSPEQLLLKYPADFFSSLVGEEKLAGETCHVMKLTPKEENSFAAAIKIWVSPKWLIRKVEVTDINGAITTYQIKELQIDTSIPDDTFEFKAPAGATTIDLR